MIFSRVTNGLKIILENVDKIFLQEISEDNHNQLCLEKAEAEFFAPYFENSEYEWIRPEEICALTSAPIIGCRGENDEVIEAYGYMDYQVLSMLEELNTNGEIFLQKG